MVIGFKGMKFHPEVGVYPEEQVLGSEIEVSIYVTCNVHDENEDELEQTLDYATIYHTIHQILEQEIKLLESACRKIMASIAALRVDVIRVKVRVAKLHPPIEGRIEQVFVEEEWVKS